MVGSPSPVTSRVASQSDDGFRWEPKLSQSVKIFLGMCQNEIVGLMKYSILLNLVSGYLYFYFCRHKILISSRKSKRYIQIYMLGTYVSVIY